MPREALHRHGVTTFAHNASTLRTLDDDERVLLVLWEERHQDQRMLLRCRNGSAAWAVRSRRARTR